MLQTAQPREHFLAILAHELRSPLTALMNSLKVIDAGGTRTLPTHEACALAARQTRRLARLIDDMLDFSRVAHGKLTLRREAVDLTSLITDALEVAGPLLSARGHLFTLTLPSRPVTFPGDPGRLQQVLVNLLSNAARYTEPGGHITLTAEATDAAVVLRVRDTGLGIPARLLPHLFEPFNQADEPYTRTAGGLGLGLALVRELVELHGGSVSAASAGPDHGSEFTVRLPRAGAGTPGMIAAEELQ